MGVFKVFQIVQMDQIAQSISYFSYHSAMSQKTILTHFRLIFPIYMLPEIVSREYKRGHLAGLVQILDLYFEE